jgi:CrcB protein
MASILDAASVALGAGIGGAARHAVTNLCARLFGQALPWGTVSANVLGSFLIGAAGAAWPHDAPIWLLAVTGGLGGFTTVSSFSLQTLFLAREGKAGGALANIALSLALGLSAAALGYGLVAWR